MLFGLCSKARVKVEPGCSAQRKFTIVSEGNCVGFGGFQQDRVSDLSVSQQVLRAPRPAAPHSTSCSHWTPLECSPSPLSLYCISPTTLSLSAHLLSVNSLSSLTHVTLSCLAFPFFCFNFHSLMMAGSQAGVWICPVRRKGEASPRWDTAVVVSDVLPNGPAMGRLL